MPAPRPRKRPSSRKGERPLPLPGTVICVIFALGCLAACAIPVGRMLPRFAEGNQAVESAAQHIAEYDKKVVAFAHKAELRLFCSPGGELGKASKASEEAFNDGDVDKDGSLSADEVAVALEKLQVKAITSEECKSMVEGGDADSNGMLNIDEFHCVAGHATSYLGRAIRYLGSVCTALAFIAFPPCAYYGFDLMHDEFGMGKSYKWVLYPLGVLAAGVAYASSQGMSAIVPFVSMYVGVAIFLLSFYGLSGMGFIIFHNIPWLMQKVKVW